MVRVPVLSEQILSEPPITSQAYIFRTRFLSCIIFYTLKARDNVTLRGSPSGMATARTTIPMMIKLMISPQCLWLSQDFSIPLSIASLISNINTMAIAEINPNFPISSAISVNFSYSGVSEGDL